MKHKQVLQELTSMAQALLDLDPGGETLIDSFEEYANMLDSQPWLVALEGDDSGDSPQATTQTSETGIARDEDFTAAVKVFAQLHEKVLEKAKMLQGEVAQQLRAQRRKGKGILAYEVMRGGSLPGVFYRRKG